MNESQPPIRWEIGWEAARAANQAFDDEAKAIAHLGKLTSAAQIEGVTIDPSVHERVEDEIVKASRDFTDYSGVTGIMIGRDVPFSEKAKAQSELIRPLPELTFAEKFRRDYRRFFLCELEPVTSRLRRPE